MINDANAKRIHRFTAIILGLFIVSHLTVHLFALNGPEAHIQALDSVQWIYRNPIGEGILVIAILVQIFTGFKRLKFKRRSKQIWARLQVMSGLYLIMFLIVHTSAALYTHHIFGLETDFYWAAGSLHFNPLRFGFAVYYFLAVLAFFTHMACAVHYGWRGQKPGMTKTLPVIGVAIASLIVATFWGVFYDIEIPQGVVDYYAKYYPGIK